VGHEDRDGRVVHHVVGDAAEQGADAADAAAELDEDEDVEVERRPLVAGLPGLSDAGSIAALALWLEGRATRPN
jgi:hypothetical protein